LESLDLNISRPPELRTNSGEIIAAENKKLPKLIELKDIRGDLHLHSTWSDGQNSIEEMAVAYEKAGYDYIAVTDHSPSLHIARGLDEKAVKEKILEIKKIQKKFKSFRILMGTECDILPDGSLDYPDEILAEMDIVVASVHNNFKMTEREQTKRIIEAIKNPYVNIIGHLHGRRLGLREGCEINLEGIMDASKAFHVALEINSQPSRLDINDSNCRLAKEKDVMIVINTDAHDSSQMEFMKFGVGMARRGWLEKKNVLNTKSVKEVLEWFGKK